MFYVGGRSLDNHVRGGGVVIDDFFQHRNREINRYYLTTCERHRTDKMCNKYTVLYDFDSYIITVLHALIA